MAYIAICDGRLLISVKEHMWFCMASFTSKVAQKCVLPGPGWPCVVQVRAMGFTPRMPLYGRLLGFPRFVAAWCSLRCFSRLLFDFQCRVHSYCKVSDICMTPDFLMVGSVSFNLVGCQPSVSMVINTTLMLCLLPAYMFPTRAHYTFEVSS